MPLMPRTNDDIEALAANGAASRGETANGSSAPSAAAHEQTSQSLSDQIAEYNDFLSAHMKAGAVDDRRSSGGSGSVGEDDSWESQPNRNLAPIPEDISTHGMAWPDYPGLGYGYDHASEGKELRYRFTYWSIYRGRCVILVCISSIALLAFIFLVAGRTKHPDNGVGVVSAQLQSQYIVWYDRSSGWDGMTYTSAEHFCSANGRELCSYESYCPYGKGKPPFGGAKNEPKGSWAPIRDDIDEWVQLSEEDTCELYTDLHGYWKDLPNWKMEEITRHVACCNALPPAELDAGGYPSDIYHRPPSLEEDDKDYHHQPELEWNNKYDPQENVIEQMAHPKWFGASDGWSGTSYGNAEIFCQQNVSGGFVCPYEVYCPQGPGSPPFHGIQGTGAEEVWAPHFNEQQLWVGIGSVNTCIERGILEKTDQAKVKYVLCCTDEATRGSEGKLQPSQPSNTAVSSPVSAAKPSDTLLTESEQAVLEHMSPLWYGRKDGYLGTTHDEAMAFCERLGDRTLCPAEGYCPNGATKDGGSHPQPLFLKMDAFEDEQWAPTARSDNSWIKIGGNLDTSCQTYETVHDNQQPPWGIDGTSTELKQHVMCCLHPESQQADTKEPDDHVVPRVWFAHSEEIHTYEDAARFCFTEMDGAYLCRYEELCPDGPGATPFSPPMMTTEQWVAIEDPNTWVLVSQSEGADSSRMCLTYQDVHGHLAAPSDIKGSTENVLCCGPR